VGTHEPTIAAYADREIIVRDGQISGVDTAVNTSSKPGKTNAGAVK